MASIRCMTFKSNLAGMNPVEYPEMASVDAGTTVNIPQKQLREMISRVVFAIATDESRQILTGCLLEVTASEARLVALDGFRLAIQKIMQPFELPADCMKILGKTHSERINTMILDIVNNSMDKPELTMSSNTVFIF